MKRIIAILIITLSLAGCTSISQSEMDYNGNSIYNIMETGKILELEDGSIYFTNYEEQKVYLYHVDEDLNLISKQVLELRDGSVGLKYLNILDNMLYGFDVNDWDRYELEKLPFVRIELNESKDILKSKTILKFDNDIDKRTLFIIVSNNRIYRVCSLGEGGYRVNLSSYNLSGRNEILHDGSFFPGSFVSNGNIYGFKSGKMFINEELFFTHDTFKYYPHYPLYYNNYIYSYAVSADSNE